MTSIRYVVSAVALATALAAPSPVRAQPRQRAVDVCIASSESAQVQRASGKLQDARQSLARCLASECPPMIRRDCDAWLGDVDRAMPTVLFRVRGDGGSDVPTAEVRVDGERVLAALDGRAHAIDPGAHTIEAVAPDGRRAQVQVVAEETVKSRVIEITLPAVAASPAPAAALRPLETTPAPAPASSAPSTGTWVTSLALGGVGVVGLGTFAVVGLGADADYRALERTCGARCSEDAAADVRERYQVADVALAASVVALAAGALVYFFGPRRAAEAQARAAQVPSRISP